MTEALHDFPDWSHFYDQMPVEKMPWYHPTLDADLAAALAETTLSGGKGLDLGTGPGTQAIELARRGYAMTGSDLSESAVRQAAERGAQLGVSVTWIADDILATQLTGPFDFVLDRGCFHVLPPDTRAQYVQTVAELLGPEGTLFLKCFSRLQPSEIGPYRFIPEQVREIFSPRFELVSIHESVYEGQLEEWPKALFAVLKRTPSPDTPSSSAKIST